MERRARKTKKILLSCAATDDQAKPRIDDNL